MGQTTSHPDADPSWAGFGSECSKRVSRTRDREPILSLLHFDMRPTF